MKIRIEGTNPSQGSVMQGNVLAPLGAYQYTQEKIDAHMADIYERFGQSLPTEALLVMELEHKGGKCPLCGVAWRPVRCNPVTMDKSGKKVLREFGDFVVHQPACRCFKRCTTAGIMVPVGGDKKVFRRVPGCGAWLVAERLLTEHGQAQKTCLNCGCVIA